MATETLYPDALLVQTGLAGAVTAIDEGVTTPDANWLTSTPTTNNVNTTCSVSFGTPTGTPNVGAGLQTFRAWVRKTNHSTNPTAVVQLWEAGVLVATVVSSTAISSTSGQTLSGTWNANLLTTGSGADVQLRVVGSVGGGGSGNRASVEIGAVEWIVDYDSAAHVTETTGSPDALTLTGYAPSLLTDVLLTTGAPDALVLTGYAPTVDTTAPVHVELTLEWPLGGHTIDFTGHAPTVSSDVLLTSGAPDALTLTGYAPSLLTDVLLTTGAPDALVVTGQAPTVLADVLVTTGAPDALVLTAPLWTPADIGASLFAWWDPSDSGTVSLSGSNITQIDDKSGNARHLVDVGTGGTIGAINGLDAVQSADSTTNYLTYSSTAVTVTDMIAVHEGSDTQWCLASHNNANFFGFTQSGSGAAVHGNAGTPTYRADGVAIASPTRADLYTAWNGAHIAHASGGDLNTSAWSSFKTYWYGFAGATYTGEWGEVILLTAVPSSALRQRIEGYLAHKWGLEANLSATHPYKAAPPAATMTADVLVTTGAPDALVLTGHAPTVTVSGGGVDVTETTGAPDALTLTGYTPTVSSDVLVTSGAPDALVLTGYAPGLLTDVLVTSGAPDALILTGYASTMTADVLVTTGAPDALVLTGYAPAVSSDVLVTSGAPDALSLTGQGPTVTSDALLTTGAPDALVLTGQVPTVDTSAGASHVTETTGAPDALTLTGYTPTVSSDVLVTSGAPDALTLTGHSPDLLTDVLVTSGAPDALTLTGHAPAVSSDALVTSGAPDALTLTGYAPSLLTDVLLTTGAPDALVLTGQAPTADVAPYAPAPAYRTITIPAERRAHTVATEPRTTTHPAERRVHAA